MTPTALKGRRNPPQGEALGILAGAMGTLLAEETDNGPKPVVEIVSELMINDYQLAWKGLTHV